MAGLLLDGGLDPRQRKRAESVRDSAESLLCILNDVLDFSKIGAGKLRLEDAPFDLRKVVEGVADLMAVKAHEKGVELFCLIEPDVPTELRGDASRLRQVLVNLVGNAVKFTGAGEVSIRVRLENAGDPSRFRFEVKDTGIGIPEDKRHVLFQPFSQVDASTARHYGGTGLGLSIVRMLVDIMGGEVRFQSEEGRGSCFWFIVPLERQSVGERPHSLSLAGRRILVVDDNAASRGLILELLKFWDAGAEQVSDPITALQALGNAKEPFDVVLVDLETPGLDCQDFPARVNQQAAGTPVVLMVPGNRTADAERWLRMGFAGHVGKPDVVADGPSALSALGEKDYDLVLMDCQLPGMDGYETSRRIRSKDSPVRNHEVPIVATTASAMAGDRERCFAAGMNNYVSKPLRPDELEQAIEEHTIGLPAPPAPPHPTPTAEAALSADTFDRDDFIDRVMGDRNLAQRLIRGFVRDMPGQLELLDRAIRAGDAKQVRLVAHRIKGAAASVGGMGMRKAAWMLERKGDSGDLAGALAALSELSARFEIARPVMEEFCESISDGQE